MQWILVLGVAFNDPNPVELIEVSTREDCVKAEAIFWSASISAAKENGAEAPDLYLRCTQRESKVR